MCVHHREWELQPHGIFVGQAMSHTTQHTLLVRSQDAAKGWTAWRLSSNDNVTDQREQTIACFTVAVQMQRLFTCEGSALDVQPLQHAAKVSCLLIVIMLSTTVNAPRLS